MSWTLSLSLELSKQMCSQMPAEERRKVRRGVPVDGDGHECVDDDADGHGVHEVGQLAHQLAELPVCAQRPIFRPFMCILLRSILI